MNPFFTIGHSTHTIVVFVESLRGEQVQLVIDVRTVPRSRKNPQYAGDMLPITLKTFDLDYMHIPELGGLRSRSPISPSINGFWHNESFHNYADYALGEEFQAGLRKLREAGHAQRCAIMCAEAVWWRCHRRIIADYLIAAGETVMHILPKGRVELARMTEAAVHGHNCTLVYPPISTIVGYHRRRRSTGWQSSPAAISSTYVIGRLSSSGHGYSQNQGGLKNRTRCFLRHMRGCSENEVNGYVFQSSRAHLNPKRVVLQRNGEAAGGNHSNLAAGAWMIAPTTVGELAPRPAQ
jgi:hypothetical protein